MALDLEAALLLEDGAIMAEADDIVGVAVAAEEVARGGDEVAAPAPSHMDGGGAGSLLARQGGEGCDLC